MIFHCLQSWSGMIISPMFSYEIIATEYQKCAVSFYQRCKKNGRKLKIKGDHLPKLNELEILDSMVFFPKSLSHFLSMPDDRIIVERQFLLIAVFRNHYFIKNWFFEQAKWKSMNEISRTVECPMSSDWTCHWISGRDWSPYCLENIWEVLSCYIALNCIFRGGFDSMKPYGLRWNFESVLDNLKTIVWKAGTD